LFGERQVLNLPGCPDARGFDAAFALV